MENLKIKIDSVKDKFPQPIEDSVFLNILFEMNRYFDKDFVQILHNKHIKINQNQRNMLRKYYYYGDNNILYSFGLDNFEQYYANKKDKLKVVNSFIDKCNKYDENKIVMSIVEKYNTISNDNSNNCKQWLNWYNKERKIHSDFSLFIIDYTQEDFIKDNYNINNILRVIADIYDHLENYRRFVFKLDGKLYDKNNIDVTWQILYKIGVYCENFVQFTQDFIPFKKEEQIKSLTEFLNKRFKNSTNEKLAQEFYKTISTGFKFEDCLISDNQEHILLVYQKIKLDQSPIPCPACMTTHQRGNSYPELFLRSYECQNPHCNERSKSGRGKRFDEFGTYRYFKMVENKKENSISEELFSKWRRDIFSNDNNIYEMLIKYYTWDNEIICSTKNIKIKNKYKRKSILYTPYNDSKYNYNFDKLPICKFFDEISNLISNKTGKDSLKKKIEIFNKDSTQAITNLAAGQVGTVITSPPYYNAREYSQWSNLIMYFIDMMSNCKAVYNTLTNKGYYLYNIGDIVNNDNIYVTSNMSKKRLQLGFLSCLIFEKAGFDLAGNIIWDKGEVQSKRNSTMNHTSGYVKCINCYEHIFIFKKGINKKSVSTVTKINPVIKINSKGENIYKHTAPYPIELVDLLKPYIIKNKYILDPFLGSGTTLKWCKKNNLKGIGYELNKEYYNLAKKYIEES